MFIFGNALIKYILQSLYTSSEFSDDLSLNLLNQPVKHIPGPDPKLSPAHKADTSGAYLILSVVSAILLVVVSIGFCIIKR